MIHYYYGNGKGKTSAAAGACVRAIGNGMKCAFIQFHKNGSSGEITALKRLGVEVSAPSAAKFMRDMTEDEINALTAEHNRLLAAVLNKGYDLIVLDELGDAVKFGTVDKALVEKIKQEQGEVIITGHKESLFPYADYITEFCCIAHPYQKGITARKGIEY